MKKDKYEVTLNFVECLSLDDIESRESRVISALIGNAIKLHKLRAARIKILKDRKYVDKISVILYDMLNN